MEAIRTGRGLSAEQRERREHFLKALGINPDTQIPQSDYAMCLKCDSIRPLNGLMLDIGSIVKTECLNDDCNHRELLVS